MSTELEWPDLRALGHLGPYRRGRDGIPVLAQDGDLSWWLTDDRRVARTRIGACGLVVSTVMLRFDHRIFGTGPPVLWETMVFSPAPCLEMRRYTSEAAARQGHREVVRALRRRRRRR